MKTENRAEEIALHHLRGDLHNGLECRICQNITHIQRTAFAAGVERGRADALREIAEG